MFYCLPPGILCHFLHTIKPGSGLLTAICFDIKLSVQHLPRLSGVASEESTFPQWQAKSVLIQLTVRTLKAQNCFPQILTEVFFPGSLIINSVVSG